MLNNNHDNKHNNKDNVNFLNMGENLLYDLPATALARVNVTRTQWDSHHIERKTILMFWVLETIKDMEMHLLCDSRAVQCFISR